MTARFPSEAWLEGLKEKLNGDAHYHEIAKNWEGDLFFFIEPEFGFFLRYVHLQ